MLNFLATTENIRKIRPEHPIYNRGKVPKKQREIAIRNFQIRNKTRVELFYPEIGKETISSSSSSRDLVFPQGVQAPVFLHVSYRESSSTIVCRTITCKLPCAFIFFVIECKFVPEHFEQGAFQSRPISQIYPRRHVW